MFFLEIAVMGLGIMMPIATKDSDAKSEPMFLCGLKEAIESLEG